MFTVEHPAPPPVESGQRRSGRSRASRVAIVALAAGVIASGLGATSALAAPSYAPVVSHTGAAPTGYSVTFSYHDASATRVQIKGEWSFLAADGTTALTAANWQPGAFPSAAVTVDMTEGSGGVWTYTTPLPSGVFNYGFFVDCGSNTGSGCTEVSDPSNAPWNESGGTVVGSKQSQSQVYVPSDPAFGTIDYSWQGPAEVNRKGALASVTYPSPGHLTPVDQNHATVYTPPGYDPARAAAYPTVYLSHGGGGNETDWSTQGDLANIMDNLIDTGQVVPMVVVSISFQGWANTCGVNVSWEPPVEADIVNNVIPYIQAHYNVSTSASQRAFSGLSCGGSLTHALLQDYTTQFGYYGILSPGGGRLMSDITPTQAAAYRKVGIFVGGGYQEPLTFQTATGPRVNALNDVAYFTKAGVPITSSFMNGTHEWYLWRQTVRDFLTHTAFKPAPANLTLIPDESSTSPTGGDQSAPVITRQPTANTTVKSGSLVFFSAAASGDPAPSVQWQRSTDRGATWTAIAGADSTAYAFLARAALNGDEYRAAFTNSVGTTYSTPAKVAVKIVTKVAAHLADATIAHSKKAVVKVTVSPTAQRPTGKLTVRYGSSTKSVTVQASDKGQVKVTLPRLKKDRYAITASFAGSTRFAASTSSKSTLRVK